MMPEPRHPPTVPSYGAAALADLSSSILASLDPDTPESQNVLGLPAARRWHHVPAGCRVAPTSSR